MDKASDPVTPASQVGVEIEFSDISLAEVAAVCTATLGGTFRPQTDYEGVVEGTQLGTLRLEVDYVRLRKMGRERSEQGSDKAATEEALGVLAQWLMPLEIVTEPLPIDQISQLDLLVDALGQAGAKGTGGSLVWAFGVHFNPQAEQLTPEAILAHMQSFLLLFDWLRAEHAVDPVREMTPFIDPFPIDYARHVLRPSYRPTMNALIDDYLKWNPERNRALDMLPLLAHLDEPRIRATVADPRVKPRPAYHYRLSNSSVGQPGWSITREWRYWEKIEALAAHDELRVKMARDFLRRTRWPLGAVLLNWIGRTRKWVSQL